MLNRAGSPSSGRHLRKQRLKTGAALSTAGTPDSLSLESQVEKASGGLSNDLK